MPKEIVKNNGTAKAPQVEFHWSKTRSDTSGSAQIGVNLFNKFKFDGDNEEEKYNSLHFTFYNRDEINKAIRILRKMRDDVFGKDA